jgi:hypothetical protein
MKKTYRAVYYLLLCMFLVGCIQTMDVPTSTLTPAQTSTPYPTTTPRFAATVTSDPNRPTLIPTIQLEVIPDLLNNSLRIETLSDFNGHSLRRITGWANGFNGDQWNKGGRRDQPGYLWLDSSHILLFPTTGQTQAPNWDTFYVQPVVMNIITGETWHPPNDGRDPEHRWFHIILPRWSPRLNLLVTAETIDGQEGASTFTVDGKRIAHYSGELIDVSPSAERIFIDGDTWIDLESGRRVDFGWGVGTGLGKDYGSDEERWLPLWSRDERQIYFCCYYYGNAVTGGSYIIKSEDTIFDRGPFSPPNDLRHAHGTWLNDHIVLAGYDSWWRLGPDFSAIFDISERTYHNFGAVTGLPDAFNNNIYTFKYISPNGDYMYISRGGTSLADPQIYLVDLKTLKAELYHFQSLEWSANGEYALLDWDSKVLRLSDKTVRTLPARPNSEDRLYTIANAWHPTDGMLVRIEADKQKNIFLEILDLDALTYEQYKLALTYDLERTDHQTAIVWHPDGERFVFVADDGSLWQMDYPTFEGLEQLTPPTVHTGDVSWSSDGRYLSYISESDIYILDTQSNP